MTIMTEQQAIEWLETNDQHKRDLPPQGMMLIIAKPTFLIALGEKNKSLTNLGKGKFVLKDFAA